MKLWLDQMLPRRLSERIAEWVGCSVWHVGTKYPEDEDLFLSARSAGAVVVTKDIDFGSLVERFGPPPQLIWLRCGNCSNRELEPIPKATLPTALELLEEGEPIVEIASASSPISPTE